MKEIIQILLLVALLQYLGFRNPFILIFFASLVCLLWLFCITGPRQTRAERKRKREVDAREHDWRAASNVSDLFERQGALQLWRKKYGC